MAGRHWLPILALAAASCSSDAARVLPTVESRGGIEVAVLSDLPDFLDGQYRWSLEPTRVIPTVRPGEAPLVFDPSAILELSNGNLLVHDPHADLVLALFDPSGNSVLARFGREGEGPGELGSWISLRESNDKVLVLDARNGQIHRFSLEGDPQGSASLSLTGVGGKSLPAPNEADFFAELFHPEDGGWYRSLARVAPDGAVSPVARLPEPSDQAEPGRIQQGRVVWSVVGANVVAMWSDRPEVFVYGREGATVRRIELPLERRDITARDIAAQIERHGGIARALRPGPAAITNELYPVGDSIFGMFTSNLWKAAADPPLGIDEVWWRLITLRGEYIGTVRLPEDFWPLGPSPKGTWARILNERGEPVIKEFELVRSDPGEDPSI